MKRILIIIAMLWSVAQAQTIGYFRYDTSKFYTTKVSGRGSIDVTGNVKFTGLLPKTAGTDSVVVRDASGNLGTTAKSAFGGSQTWQQTLTTGSTLTGNNTIAGGGFDFTWNNANGWLINGADDMVITTTNGGLNNNYFGSLTGGVEMASTNLSTTRSSNILVESDTIRIRPSRGGLLIDTLTNAVGTRAVRYNPISGLVSYADTTTGGNYDSAYNNVALIDDTSFTLIRFNGQKDTIAFSGFAGGVPGGSNTQVQYNNAGAFGGISGATTNGTTLTLAQPIINSSASGDTTTYKPFGVSSAGITRAMTYWPGSGGGGSMAIGSAITSATAGSVLFAGTGGVLQQKNADFFYDSTNKRLGIGTASPTAGIHVVRSAGLKEAIFASSTSGFSIQDYTADATYHALYATGVTPSGSNATLLSYGTVTWLSATTTAGILLNSNPMVTATSTNVSIGGNLIAGTDNSKDIGASGATRFRDLFLARNAVIGGTINVTGTTTLQGAVALTDGANKSVGVSAAMTAGTITISNTRVTANSRIFLTHATIGGTQGILSVGTISAGTSFVINSSSATDTGTVNWLIIN